MSFAESVREELSELPIKHPCCRRALTAGLLLGARMTENKSVSVRYRSEVVATLASAMIHTQYGCVPESEMTGKCGHRYYDLAFSSPACRKYLYQMQEGDLDRALRFACESCRSAFLRGAFLACGTVNDPHRSFHLEFLLPDERMAVSLSRVLSDAGYPPRQTVRPNQTGLYYKDGGTVEELIGLMGAQHVIFEIINSRIERDIRNNENRATNCVTKNIEKSISAAARQIEAINVLIESGRLERLSEPLRVTAQTRYRHPDATLDELVLLHNPPISRSGLNHRLKKLMEEAEDVAGKETT
ncbi:MAG: DNA-binding protein WhiA [Ruminococcaceae bacterium]|nr:DNA-binding protein WhiA [Oscillospiraceae bacterium]